MPAQDRARKFTHLNISGFTSTYCRRLMCYAPFIRRVTNRVFRGQTLSLRLKPTKKARRTQVTLTTSLVNWWQVLTYYTAQDSNL